MKDRSRGFGVATRALLLLPLLYTGAGAGEPPAAKVNGALSRIDGMPVLRVWGTPQERGYAHGFLLGKNIVSLVDAFLSSGTLGGSVEGYKNRILPMLSRMTIDPEYEAELRGLLAGVEAQAGGTVLVPCLGRTMRYDDLAAINCTADFTRMGCSSFAVWGPMTKDGYTLAGRNMDWPAVPALLGTQIIVVNVPSLDSGKLGWVSITWPGYVICTTGMNAEGVTVSMHDAGGLPPSTNNGFTPRGLALREAIESAHAATAFEDVARVLRERVCAVGNNIMVTRPRGDNVPAAAVFEYDGYLPNDKGVTIRNARKGENFIACTNHYRKRAEPVSCGRYSRLSKRLERIAGAGGRKHLTQKTARTMLDRVSMEGIITHHSVVFEPNKRLMHVAFATDGKHAPRCKFVTLDVTKLLQGPDAVAGGE